MKGRPFLDHVLDHARSFGHEEVVVNAHWLAPQIVAWAQARPGVTVSVEEEILGTGGGLRHARHLLAERFVVLNGDILADVDLDALMASRGRAVMALRHRDGPQTAIAAEDGCVTGIAGVVGPASGAFSFTGVHVLDRDVLDLVPPGAQCIVRTAYRHLVPERAVGAWLHGGTWIDIGTHADYERVR